MNNTILSAKNSFQEGLIMDFSPEQTQAGCLTNALNATLLTFNGNEMSLQNDMGNARVETARLPDGYIPVGTCEFGDIIYIVSYNPLTNKSQIGCFPSPERNISSEEIGGLGQTLLASDFQELDSKSKPTGKLKATSVKKILMEKSLNPGDKFIIYDKSGNIRKEQYITDVGNTDHDYGKFPKLLKIHVVAIEDSGKINYLDSSLKWYKGKADYHDYFMLECLSNDETVPDIDSYRSMLSSGYSVFQSKVSGKLALLIELEKISGFSLTYDVYKNGTIDKTDPNITYNNFDVYWNLSWTTDNELINPSCLTYDSDITTWQTANFIYGKETSKQLPLPTFEKTTDINGNEIDRSTLLEISRTYKPENIKFDYTTLKSTTTLKPYSIDDVEYHKVVVARTNGIPDEGKYILVDAQDKGKQPINDDVVNNCYKQAIYKKYGTFQIPSIYDNGTTKYDLSKQDMIYNYKVIPCMPYGMLEDLAVEGSINFGKIGTGEINLTQWRYYNTDSISTITLGLEAYVEANKGIAGVVLEFYDNQGIAAALHIENRNSYSGVITEQIPLNGSFQNFKMKTVDSEGTEFVHAGLQLEEFQEGCVYFNTDKKPKKAEKPQDTTDTTTYYQNDAGTLYPNYLYGVKIIIKYTTIDALGQLDIANRNDYKIYNVWYWTSNMYNDYYYNTYDFSTLELVLGLDIGAEYVAQDTYQEKKFEYKSSTNLVTKDYWRNLRANVQYIKGDISVKCDMGLLNTYNMFSLSPDIVKQGSDMKVFIGLGKKHITYSNESPQLKQLYDESYILPEQLLPLSASSEYTQQFTPTFEKLKDPEYSNSTNLNNKDIFDVTVDEGDKGENYKLYPDQFNMSLSFTGTNHTQSNTSYITYNSNLVEDYKIDFFQIPNADIPNKITKDVKLTVDLLHFSKYIPIYENKQKYLNCIKPVLYDLTDLNKYNLTYIKDKFYIKTKVNFVLSDEGGDQDPQFGFRFFDVFDINDEGIYTSKICGKYNRGNAQFQYSQLKNTSDYNWLEKASSTNDGLYTDKYPQFNYETTIFPQGFSILHFPIQIKDSNESNYKKDDGYIIKIVEYNNINAEYKKQYITKGTVKFSAHPTTLVFNGDKYNNPHILNQWINLDGINQDRFIELLLSVFTQLYVLQQNVLENITITKDILYLDKYTTLYTQDVIYKTKLPESALLKYINFYGNNLAKYAKKIQEHLGTFKNEEGNDQYNLNIFAFKLNDIQKNIPIQWQCVYNDPNFQEEIPEINTVIKTIFTTKPTEYTSKSYEPNQLYFYNKGILQKLNKEFHPYHVEAHNIKLNTETNILQLDPIGDADAFGLYKNETAEGGNPIDYNSTIEYLDDRVILKRYSKSSTNKMYKLYNNNSTAVELRDLFKEESLIEQYYNPNTGQPIYGLD